MCCWFDSSGTFPRRPGGAGLEASPIDARCCKKRIMRFVNLTPHKLTILGDDDQVVKTIDSSGVARVDVQRTQVDSIDGVPIYDSTYGDVDGLPDPQDDTMYVVSGLVASATDRADVVSPGDLVRDDDGNVVGARGLTR